MKSMYVKKDIQQAMVENARNREIAIRYGNHFGKRPDIITYPDEVLDLIKQGATSFHASEELWENPKLIVSDMRPADVAKLRKGWDLILDIDSPVWKISKITAWLIIQALKDFGISSISVKFSGNKGFHIGVPFEAFPETYREQKTKDLFPDAPRRIATFLLDYINQTYIAVKENQIVFGEGLKRRFRVPYEKLLKVTGKSMEKLTFRHCSKCRKKIDVKTERKVEFYCPKCSNSIKSEDKQFEKCPKCKILMEKFEGKKSLCSCGSNESYIMFNPSSIIEVDTILISSRHLFRMPYSMHEKSGLVSIPFNPDKILEFEKKYARPEIIKVSKHIFIDRDKTERNEASMLLGKALAFSDQKEEVKIKKEYEEVGEAVPETLFPPTIKKMLEGLEDGRKRALFILINFLKCVGWSHDLIEKRIKEWNKKNKGPLKEQIIIGQLRYQKNKERVPPPNYDKDYYSGIGITPAEEEMRFKNPVRYALARRG
ncbi:hypothetical protein GOV09_02370 [Candidatus Woesearchaeota archaeon]|nr:hypothetical protein [Candidatus Woesearchaeota archaeon]